MTAPRRVDLTTGPIGPHLLRLSIPMIWGILSIVSMQLADVYFIGQLGHTELAAISFTFPISMIVFNLVMGLSIATASISARLIGAGEADEMKHFIAHAILLSGLVGIVLAAIGISVIDPIFTWMGAGPDHLPFIRDFLTISLWGYIFITVPLAGNAALRAGGDTLTPSLIMVGIGVINIPLSYALIFGAWGLPAWGVAGAATANVTANFLAALLCLVMLNRRHIIDRTCLTLRDIGVHAKKLFAIAIPVGLTNLMTPLTAAIITTLLAAHSAQAVAAYGIITRIEAMIAVVLMAVSIGMGPIIGQNYGAGQTARVEHTIRLAIVYCIVWSAFTGFLFMFLGGTLGREFTGDPATIHIVATYFWIIGITPALINVATGWGSAWNAMGKPQVSAQIMLVRYFIGGGFCAYIGNLLGGWHGLFIGLMVGNLICGLALHLYSARLFNRLAR